jgi:uncharacterized protein YjdB
VRTPANIHSRAVGLIGTGALAVLVSCAVGGATIVDPATTAGIAVNPAAVTMTVGGPIQTLQASVTVAHDAEPTVTWISSDPSVARVAPNGTSAVIAGLKAGSATITATSTVNASMHGDATVRVMAGAPARIIVTAGAAQLAAFATLPLHAVALDVAGDTLTGMTFSWSASNPSVATVDASGRVTGVALGAVSITAKAGSVTSSAVVLTVVNPPVAALAVSAPTSSIRMPQTLQAQAVAKDASGNVLQGVAFSWASSNTQVAAVSKGGLITGMKSGTASITAKSGQVTSNGLVVTVTGPGGK